MIKLLALLVLVLGGCKLQQTPLSNPQIVGGIETDFEEFPSVVAYSARRGKGASSLCTGTLLSSKTILTAAHCVYKGPKKKEIQISIKKNCKNKKIEVTRSEQLIVHPDYKELFGQGRRLANDLAMIHLADNESIECDFNVLSNETVDEGDMVEIVGFGGDRVIQRRDGSLATMNSNKLRYGYAQVVSVRSDFYTLSGQLTKREEIEEGEFVGAASGDSGGPMLDDSGAVLGVASFVLPIIRGKMENDSHYVNIAQHWEWISENIKW